MELKDCKLCKEREYGRGPVPGSGLIDALVCLLGRNPGVTEDARGKPFVGRAGGKLNAGLVIAGLPRVVCWIDNVSKCMTPTNVAPTQQCLKICSSTWLRDTLKSMPRLQLVVTLGNQALHYFEPHMVVGEYHGIVLPAAADRVGKQDVSLFVSYHPSAALRSSLMNEHFTNDMVKLGKYLRENQLTEV